MFRCRRVLAICLLLLVCLSFVSCVDLSSDPALKGLVTFSTSDDGTRIAEYQGAVYLRSRFFCVQSEESDPMISWDMMINLMANPGRFIYADRVDDPFCIYHNSPYSEYISVYLPETYDYASDTFVLDGTDASILWSEVLTEKTMLLMADYRYTITMHSEVHPRILAYMQICRVNREWYASFYQEYYGVDNKEMYKLSDMFVALLVENGLIEDINWPDTTPAES